MIRKTDAFLLAAVFGCLSTPAYAYLDPGTGSMIVQVIIGAIAAGLVSIKLAWRRIVDFVGSILGRKRESNAESNQKK